MNRKFFRLRSWLMWLRCRITALRFGLVGIVCPLAWPRTSSTLGRPNGWMTREMSLVYTALGVYRFMRGGLRYCVIRRPQDPDSRMQFPGRCWVSFICVIGVCLRRESRRSGFNLRLHYPWNQIVSVVHLAIALIAWSAVVHRVKIAATICQSWMSMAEEVSRLARAGVFCSSLSLLAQIWGPHRHPDSAGPPRVDACGLCCSAVVAIHMGLASIISSRVRASRFALWVSACGPFHAMKLSNTQVESWNPLRGYGIRGIGDRRAYVWGNQGVRIKTTEAKCSWDTANRSASYTI